jgi:hypothetical protein
MNQGVEILLARMESNPEDFEKGGNLESIFGIAYINQHWGIFTQEEKDALNNAYKEIQRGEFTQYVISRIVDTPKPTQKGKRK